MEKITITQGVPFCTIQTSCRNYPKKKFCSISLQNFWNVLINISHNKSARTIPLGLKVQWGMSSQLQIDAFAFALA